MKYLPLAFILLIVSCKDKVVPPPSHSYTRQVKAVYNSCINKWAIQTALDKYGPTQDTFVYRYVYFGKPSFGLTVSGGIPQGGTIVWIGENNPHDDTVDNTIVGAEFQFVTRDSALLAYAKWTRNPDTLQRGKEIADSIWKCNHTYK